MINSQQFSQKRESTGFTLIEVMVVVVILGILAAVVVPRVMSRPEEARIIRAQQDIRALASALKLYRLDNFNYPSTDESLQALIERPENLSEGARWKQGGYLERLPKDPWGNGYQYLYPGARGDFDLYSMGADGVSDGEEANADIGNWAIQ